MKLKFDLQFFGGGGSSTYRVPIKDPPPDELVNLRQGIFNKLMPGLNSFNTENWNKAQQITDNALDQIGNLSGKIPGQLDKANSLVDSLSGVLQSGEIPSSITDKLNAGVTKDLQSSMGSMLNNLSKRGVLNSSITSQGTSRLGQQAADAFNKNYLNAFNSVVNGYGSAISGAQGNTSALLQSISAMSGLPSAAFSGAYAGLTPAYNFWKDWQNSYDGAQQYDTVVEQGGSSCITGDTLVTLEDGREIPVSELKDDDKIMTWDFENGCVTSAPLTALFKKNFDEPLDIIRVKFDDGSSIGIIYEHLFFDVGENKFVAINSDSQKFIGHLFAKVDKDGYINPVKVVKIFKDGLTTETYAPQCLGHLNFLANGLISANDGQLGLCNRFDFDFYRMCYDKEKKEADLLKYGRLDYDSLKDLVSEDFFYKNHGDEFSVAFGKGLITLEQLRAYLEKFANYFMHI